MGDPEEYRGNLVELHTGVDYDQRSILRRLVDLQYDRNDMTLGRGKFRVRGDTIEVHPAYDETVLRIEMFGDTVDRLTIVDPLTGEHLRDLSEVMVFPATHYVAGAERMERAVKGIEAELQERLAYFEKEGKLLEAQRLAWFEKEGKLLEAQRLVLVSGSQISLSRTCGHTLPLPVAKSLRIMCTSILSLTALEVCEGW